MLIIPKGECKRKLFLSGKLFKNLLSALKGKKHFSLSYLCSRTIFLKFLYNYFPLKCWVKCPSRMWLHKCSLLCVLICWNIAVIVTCFHSEKSLRLLWYYSEWLKLPSCWLSLRQPKACLLLCSFHMLPVNLAGRTSLLHLARKSKFMIGCYIP